MPVYCATGHTVQSAMHETIHALKESKAKFDAAASGLGAIAEDDPIRWKDVVDWIDGCRMLCIGNLTWRWVICPSSTPHVCADMTLLQS